MLSVLINIFNKIKSWFVPLLILLVVFGIGYYFGNKNVKVVTLTKEVPVEKIVTKTETKTQIQYVEKSSPNDADIDVSIPKQNLKVSVNGKEQVINKADNEKYVFDKNKLTFEQSSSASLDIKVPTITVDKTRRWSLGVGGSKNGVAGLIKFPVKDHVGGWVYGDKKTIAGGVSINF